MELKENDIVQSARLYIFMKGKLRWITTGKIFEKMIADPEIPISWDWKKRKFLGDEEIKAKRGKDITKWPEEGNNGDNGDGHQTDRVYKMLYVCPWYSKQSGFGGLDEIKEVGFDTLHTYSPFQWEQRGYWDTPEGRADCLRQIREMLEALRDRGMYGCFNVPLGGPRLNELKKKIKNLIVQRYLSRGTLQEKSTRQEISQLKEELQTLHGASGREYLAATAEVMKDFDNGMACTGEEPDCSTPPSPTLEEQKDIHDTIKLVGPEILVCASFNGGDFCRAMNPDAFDLIFPNSYPYTWNLPAIPDTPAAQTGDFSLPWWEISEWLAEVKFPMMHRCVPKDMPMINICQGFYNPRHHLPNVEEEWEVYNKEFGLNSFAIYPHGAGQGQDCVCVMQDNRPESYSIKNQCRELMKKLDSK